MPLLNQPDELFSPLIIDGHPDHERPVFKLSLVVRPPVAVQLVPYLPLAFRGHVHLKP